MKYYTNRKTTHYLLLIYSLLLLVVSSCKKDIVPVLPGDKDVMSLNFYPASDVLSSYAQGYIGIYLDGYEKNPAFSSSSRFPFFFYNNGRAFEYPTSSGFGGNGIITYSPFNAGAHRLMFTDTTNTVVLDTAFNQPAQSYTCLYLADAPTALNAPAVYKLVVVPEDRFNTYKDKVGVRFIHLSADAGSLVCSRQNADGSLQNIAIPRDLQFGEASSYTFFDTADAVNGILRFSLNNAVNGASVITGVPFNPGKSYIVVISGFFNAQQRQISIGKNDDGSIKYKSITIGRNLHADLRKSY